MSGNSFCQVQCQVTVCGQVCTVSGNSWVQFSVRQQLGAGSVSGNSWGAGSVSGNSWGKVQCQIMRVNLGLTMLISNCMG